MGNAGQAILFMMSFAASIIVGIAVLAFAARCVLVIVQETGQGQDEVVWPNEPIQDWLGHAAQFLELLGIWVAPAALASRLLRYVWLPDDGPLRLLLLVGPGLWLFFPIGLLSSLSAESRWVPFRWTIFVCFLRVAPAALVFYFLSALFLSVPVVLWYYALFGGRGELLPVAAAVSGAALFIYARLLGRLAGIIQRLPAAKQKPAQTTTAKRPQPGRKKKRKSAPQAQDPWKLPQGEQREHQTEERFPWAKKPPEQPKPGYHVPSAEEIEGYGFAAETPPASQTPPEKPTRSRFAMSPDEYEPYQMGGTSEPEPPAPRETPDDLFAEQVRQRIAERTRTQPSLPSHPFLNGVFTFPLYGASLPNWLALALAFLAEGGLIYFTLAFGRDLFHW